MSDVVGVEAILRAHKITVDGSCRCGWGSDGLVLDEGEMQVHVEHVAEVVYGCLRDEVAALRTEVPALRARVAELEAGETEWALRWGPADSPVVKPVETEKRARALAPHVHDAGMAPEIVSRSVGPWLPADETGAAS